MMPTRREEVLRATSEAARVLAQFKSDVRTSFDIVGTVLALEIPLMFRPLKGLWGAAITVDREQAGVIVTTKLGLAVQRFTLAHELGHVLLGHETSLDESVGFLGRFGPTSRPTQELAADVFASELLAAKSLVLAAAQRHGWNRAALLDATNVYQLSLRLGISFEAACWALVSHGVCTREVAKVHLDTTVLELKRSLALDIPITNSWADVWALSQADSGTMLEAGPEDLFALHVSDNASAGFLWELVDTSPTAVIVGERRAHESAYGSPTRRTLFIRFAESGVHRLSLMHRRPWNRQTTAHIDISISTDGKESGGFARRHRELAVSAGPA